MIDLAAPSPPAAPAAAPETGSRRVVFVDLARALAVLFMLYGHAISALLAPEYQGGAWFEVWQFQRGLTACLFLLLSGFAFSIATSRRWALHLGASPQLAARLRRFGFYVLLGYGLHFPVGSVVALAGATEAQWRALFAVDVLQLIGTTFIGVQLLVLLTRSPMVFAGASLLIGAAVVAATPAIWRIDWTLHLPLGVASFLSPATGSLFPLFPWAGYVLIGSALGQIYARWGMARPSAFIAALLMFPGVVLVAGGRLLRVYQTHLFGAEPYSYVPPEALIRVGTCLLIVGAIAYACRSWVRLPVAIAAVAQESLLIYFVHLCIVYGSIWNPGLAWIVGASLTPGPMLLVVAVLIASMVLLAVGWHGVKHRSPRRARWMAVAAGGALVLRLV